MGVNSTSSGLNERGNLAKLDLSDGNSLYAKLVVRITFERVVLPFKIYNTEMSVMNLHISSLSYRLASNFILLIAGWS